MATKLDVIKARDAAVDAYDQEIVAATGRKNASPHGHKMTQGIQDMRSKRTEMAVQDYVAALNDPAFKKALEAIEAATTDMNETAEKMKEVTEFVTNVAGYVEAGSKIVSALRGA